MKKITTTIFGLLALLQPGCGLSEDEIRSALRDAEKPTKSGLDFKIGQAWTETYTAVETNLTLKLEKGEYTHCDFADLMTTADCPTAVVGSALVTDRETQNFVVGMAQPAALALPAYAIRATSQTTEHEEYYSLADGMLSDDGVPAASMAAELYTLGEDSDFVVRLGGGDHDVTRGDALFPANPRVDRVYVDDNGVAWRVTEPTTVNIGGLTDLAAHRIVKATRVVSSLPDFDHMKTHCVAMRPASDMETSVEPLNKPGDPCRNAWLIEENVEWVVYNDLPVKFLSEQRWLTFKDVYSRQADGSVLPFFKNADGDGTLVFEFHDRRLRQESEITKLSQ